MKKLHILLITLIFTIFTMGCSEKPIEKETITLNKDNFGLYFDWFVIGTSATSLASGQSVYISEALDDNGDYYAYGFVYEKLEIPFSLKSLTDKYECEDCKFEVKVTGSVQNIYAGANLNSSKRKSTNVNKKVTIDIPTELKDGSIIATKSAIISALGSPINDVNGLYTWELDWELVSASGTLIEK